MSYELHGNTPQNETGKSFRNNNIWWAPLREYVLEFAGDCLTDKEKAYWHCNDGNTVSQQQATDIGDKLLKLIEQGHTKAFEELFEEGTSMPFTVENVQQFADFCLNSGGFSIC